jgi:hypothetical protein
MFIYFFADIQMVRQGEKTTIGIIFQGEKMGDLRGRQRTERIEQYTLRTWKDMGGKREPSASVGAEWIHVSEPTQPHIQNDAGVELAICQRKFMG